jgi:hypothetical protein
MPNKRGRPKLEPSGNTTLDKKREYARKYYQKKKKNIELLGEEFIKVDDKNIITQQKLQRCTNKVRQLVKDLKDTKTKLDKSYKITDDIITEYDEKLRKKVGKGMRRKKVKGSGLKLL